METIGILSSIIASIMAIATLLFSVRNSKKNILKRIEDKEYKVHRIDNQLIEVYGINGRGGGPLTKLDEKKAKLEKDIVSLKRLL